MNKDQEESLINRIAFKVGEANRGQLKDIHNMVYVIAQDVSALKQHQIDHTPRFEAIKIKVDNHDKVITTGKYLAYGLGSLGLFSNFGAKIAEFLHIHGGKIK